MTLIEAILARASGKKSVKPGDIVVAEVDRMIMHDISGYMTTRLFDEKVSKPIPHPDRLTMVFDHIFSPPREHEATVLQWDRKWARKHGIRLLESGSGNIHNAVLQRGLISPGMVVVGSDSHTPVHGVMGAFAAALGNDAHAGVVFPYSKAWFRVPATIRIELDGELRSGTTPRDVALFLVKHLGEGSTVYRALEFGGSFVQELSLSDRWLFPLIAVDVGAKCGYCDPDEKTFEFVREVGAVDHWKNLEYASVEGRIYERVIELDVSKLEPQVACPPSVGNVKSVSEVAGKAVQYLELGGHGGGRIDDLRIAASILEGKAVHPDVQFNVVPSSREAFSKALNEGLVAILHEAGATWYPPSTGSNQAVNMGAMAAGDVMLSTHSRNFPGRNGSAQAEMYLASSLTVAVSALSGRISDVRENQP